MKGQTELEVVKLKSLPQLTAKGLSTLHSPVLETLNLKSSGVTSEGIHFLSVIVMCFTFYLTNMLKTESVVKTDREQRMHRILILRTQENMK